MKADLREDGTLVITGQTNTEAYALRKWGDDWVKDKSGEGPSKIVVMLHEPAEVTNGN